MSAPHRSARAARHQASDRHATASMHGAVSILNATATGHGCSLAIRGGVQADWSWTDGDHLEWLTPGMDDRLVRAVHRILQERFQAPIGARVLTRSTTAPGRGLKTSSSAAAALLLAGARALHQTLEAQPLATLAVQAAVAARVTLTGAFDDQVAVIRGGCHLTDNRAMQVLASFAVPDLHVAVWVPAHAIAKADVARVDTAPIRAELEAAEALLRSGDLAGAMTANGAAFTRLYKAAGLSVTDEPAQVALEHGAIGTGLSGTGPAIAALFAAPTALPAVPGGTWTWTRTVAEGVPA